MTALATSLMAMWFTSCRMRIEKSTVSTLETLSSGPTLLSGPSESALKKSAHDTPEQMPEAARKKMAVGVKLFHAARSPNAAAMAQVRMRMTKVRSVMATSGSVVLTPSLASTEVTPEKNADTNAAMTHMPNPSDVAPSRSSIRSPAHAIRGWVVSWNR